MTKNSKSHAFWPSRVGNYESVKGIQRLRRGKKNRLNRKYVLYGWNNLKFYQFCAARLHVESCALSNKKTLLMKISLLLTELAHFLDAPQCDYHTINCQVSKIGLIESTNGLKFFESTKNFSPSSPPICVVWCVRVLVIAIAVWIVYHD